MTIFKRLGREGFSLIEIIFVILIIGIISTVALPKLFETSKASSFVKLSSDIAIIQNGLKTFQDKSQMNSEVTALNSLDDDDKNLFSRILENPIVASSSYPFWSKQNSNSYLFHFDSSTTLEFIYNSQNMTFTCDKNLELCEKLN